jgi:hypothetical protein
MAKSGHKSEMPLVDWGEKELEGMPRVVGLKILVDQYQWIILMNPCREVDWIMLCYKQWESLSALRLNLEGPSRVVIYVPDQQIACY